jgi:hypothetical protein
LRYTCTSSFTWYEEDGNPLVLGTRQTQFDSEVSDFVKTKKGGCKMGWGKDKAKRMLSGTDKVQHNCCGGVGRHLGGCDGKVHSSYDGASHSGEIITTVAKLKKFKEAGGTFHSAHSNAGGKMIVHVKKTPAGWSW